MKHAIAIDIGGTNIKYALVDNGGNILYESLRSAKSNDNETSLIDLLKAIVTEIRVVASSFNFSIVGIGIGVPSVIDDGVVLFANNLPELDNQNLQQIIADYSDLPVFVDNDANLMGLGEVVYGGAKGISDAVFLTIGTGIGGTLILNGQLYGGYRNRGTELGHIIVNCDGNPCSCGARGCFEAHAAVIVLIEEYKKLLIDDIQTDVEIDGKYIVSRYEANEEAAIIAMNNHFYYIAMGVVSLINIFAPQKIIIGGGISESGDFYIDNIQKLVKELVMKETSCFTTIERASLGNKAGFLGSAALVFKHM
ncbi:ROK family protein [Dysgonomonas sp. ZJ709]|uniref:ROK family protein n=1 Tax=Dysgonomonas sp. ZJ709 TaxID=2709797 RepID=UPI0013EE3243|nr:ROK family protein [Dysgonomonas sp. ZJ709]